MKQGDKVICVHPYYYGETGVVLEICTGSAPEDEAIVLFDNPNGKLVGDNGGRVRLFVYQKYLARVWGLQQELFTCSK